MKKEYDISVVIPFYKGKEYLKQAIKSIEIQTIKPIEVIVVNDGSEEKIDDLQTNANNVKIINQRNKGAAAARNRGIKEAKGEYIAFLDSDDLWDKKKLEFQIEAMVKDKTNWSYHSYLKFYDEKINIIENEKNEHEAKMIFPLICNSCKIATPSVMVKRDILIDNNFWFNENLIAGEDTCLWYDLAQKYKVTIIRNNLCYVRMHGNNAAYDIKKQIIARHNIWEYIKQRKNLHKEVRLVTKIAYEMCSIDSKIVQSKAFGTLPKTIESFFSKALFLIPWLLFKTEYIIRKR